MGHLVYARPLKLVIGHGLVLPDLSSCSSGLHIAIACLKYNVVPKNNKMNPETSIQSSLMLFVLVIGLQGIFQNFGFPEDEENTTSPPSVRS